MQQQHRALGALPRYADGGLIKQVKAGLNRLVGNNPDAQRQRGRTDEIEPQPKATTAGYASGTPTKDNPAGIKFARGGKVKGPGTGTSDDVPIMASNGEYVIKAKAVQALGVKTLDALNAIADKDPHKGKKVSGKRKLGAVPHMRYGGSLDEELRKAQKTGRGVAPYVNHRAPTGAPAMQPPLQIGNSTPPKNAVATQPYRPNFTMPGDGAPTRVVPDSQASKVTDVRAKFNPANASPEYKAFMAERGGNLGPQAPAAQPAAQPSKPSAASRLGAVRRTPLGKMAGGTLLTAIPEALDTARVAQDPNATGIDVATQAAEGLGRVGAATAGAGYGAAAGSALGPVGTVVGGLAGGALGYYGADKAIEAGRNLLGVDPRSPVDMVPTNAPIVARGSGRRLGATQDPRSFTNPNRTAGLPGPQVSAPVDPNAPTGQVTRVGNSYSGANVAGPITINGREPRGGFVGGTGDGTFKYGGTGGQSGNDQALQAARMAAIERGDVEAVRQSYGGNFGGKVAGDVDIDALRNNGRPMTARKLGAINKALADRDAAAAAGEDRAMARTKGALDNKKTSLEIKAAESLLAAQDRLNSAKTEEERGRAMKELMALQGKYDKELPNRFTVVPGGQAITDQGVPYTVPARVINNQTGQFVEQPQQQQPMAPPAKGTVQSGYRFKGGDPSKQSNWEKV